MHKQHHQSKHFIESCIQNKLYQAANHLALHFVCLLLHLSVQHRRPLPGRPCRRPLGRQLLLGLTQRRRCLADFDHGGCSGHPGRVRPQRLVLWRGGAHHLLQGAVRRGLHRRLLLSLQRAHGGGGGHPRLARRARRRRRV